MSKIIKGAAKAVGGALGLSGGAGEAREYAMDPAAFSELYQSALSELQGVGRDPASQARRAQIEQILGSQLAGLEGDSAARKAQLQEDLARGFAADTQSLARARGGTGTLAQALRMPGSMYDAQARARARGLTDLYSQATRDLGSLQGVQQNLYGQDLSRAGGLANVYQGELASRRGTQSQNLANQFTAQQAMYGRLGDTLKAGASLIAGMPAGGGKGLTSGQKLGGLPNTDYAVRQEKRDMGSMW